MLVGGLRDLSPVAAGVGGVAGPLALPWSMGALRSVLARARGGLGPLAKKCFGFHGLGSGLRGSQIWFSVPRSRFGPAWVRLVGPWAPVLETKFLVRLFEGSRSGPLGPSTVLTVVGSDRQRGGSSSLLE